MNRIELCAGALACVLLATAAPAQSPKRAAAPKKNTTIEAASFRTYQSADLKPLAPSEVSASVKPNASAAGAENRFASVEASLSLASEALKGGCETASSSGESPFRALQAIDFKLPGVVAAASERCPAGTHWDCILICKVKDPLGNCVIEVPLCGCY